MLRKMAANLDTTNLEYTPQYASNLADNIKECVYNILNYEEIQVKNISSGKIFSGLLKMPNSINIAERLSLIDGVEVLNINAPIAPEQYTSIETPNTPMIVKTDQEYLINNNYIKVPVKSVVADLSKDLDTFGEVALTFLSSRGVDNLEVVVRASDAPFTTRNISYENKTVTLVNSNEENSYLGFFIKNLSIDPLRYSLFYTTTELAKILGGKPSIIILTPNMTFNGNRTLESLPLGTLALVFDRDLIVVHDRQVVISTMPPNTLIGRSFNLTKQSVLIPTKSQNVNDIFGNKNVKYKILNLPVSFIQAGDFLSDIEITNVNKTEATLSEPVSAGPKTVTLGTYKRWKQLCKDVLGISYTHKTLDDYNNMNPNVLRTEINRLAIVSNSLTALFKTYSFGRLQSFVIKGLNALSDAHRANNYDIALDNLFSGNLVGYTNLTDDDCNSNKYLINVIKKTIYDLVTT